MRYIEVGGYVTPKHCIYGPRPAEGLVLNNYEWWSITDHMVKDQRERELAAVLKAKEEAKKDLSFQMTSKWSNTMASIKTQASQKREEKKEKQKQDRIDQYNSIMRDREEKKRKLLKEVRRVIFEQSDAAKTITSAVHYATVIADRRKQIEMKNFLQAQEAKKQREWVMKIKKDVEDYKREKCQEKLAEKAKNEILKKWLAEQLSSSTARVAELNKKRQEEKEEFEAQKEDAIRMNLEGEKIHQCNMVELEYRKKFAARYMKKSKLQLQHERNLKLEEEEEDEINKIYVEYDRKFKKERKVREEKMKNEAVERRQKISEMLAQKMAAAAAKEAEMLNNAMKEKEEQADKEEEEKKERDRKYFQELLEGKRKSEAKRAKERHEAREARKWEMIQNYARAEVNREWKRSFQIAKEKMQKEIRETYDRQCQEKKEQQEAEHRLMLSELPNEEAEKEELENYIKETMDFAKEYNLPLEPIITVISNIKDEYGLENKEKQEMIDKRNQIIEQQQQQLQQGPGQGQRRKSKPLGYGCYCFKY